MKEKRKEELIRELLNKELSYVNKTIEDVKDDPEWFTNNTLTEEQHAEWKKFCLDKIAKYTRMGKKKAEYEFAMFDLNYGLRVIRPTTEN